MLSFLFVFWFGGGGGEGVNLSKAFGIPTLNFP